MPPISQIKPFLVVYRSIIRGNVGEKRIHGLNLPLIMLNRNEYKGLNASIPKYLVYGIWAFVEKSVLKYGGYIPNKAISSKIINPY